jgi:hypothetical protein
MDSPIVLTATDKAMFLSMIDDFGKYVMEGGTTPKQFEVQQANALEALRRNDILCFKLDEMCESIEASTHSLKRRVEALGRLQKAQQSNSGQRKLVKISSDNAVDVTHNAAERTHNPAERNLIPAERTLIPAERNLIPAERNLIPAERNLIPAEDVEKYAESYLKKYAEGYAEKYLKI